VTATATEGFSTAVKPQFDGDATHRAALRVPSSGLLPDPMQLDHQTFLEAFEDCRLAADCFRHREHVRLAWILLRRFPLVEVVHRVSAGLRRFAAHHGSPGMYNETLTWIYVTAINQRLQEQHLQEQRWQEQGVPASDTDSEEMLFEGFCRRNGDLFGPVRGFMERWYNPETWTSELAKATFVLPDR